MEHVGAVVDKGARTERAYEKYGWMILTVSAVFGIVATVMTTLPPLYVFSSPIYEDTYPIMGALGTALVGFNVFALVMILIPLSKGRKVGLVHAMDVAAAVAFAVRAFAGSHLI